MDDIIFNQTFEGGKLDQVGDCYKVHTELGFLAPVQFDNMGSLLIKIHIEIETLKKMSRIRKSFEKVVFLMW